MNHDELRKHNEAILAEHGLPQIKQRIHTCDVCGKQELWGPEWATWGSLASAEDGQLLKYCSDQCRESIKPRILWRKKFGVPLTPTGKIPRVRIPTQDPE